MGSVASAQPEGACRSSTTVPDAVAACAPPAPGGIPSDFGAESEVSSHSLASSEESSLPVAVHENQEVDEGGSSKGDGGNAMTESEDDSEESRASDSPRCSEEGSEMPARNPWKSFLDLASSLEPWNQRLWRGLTVPLRTGFSWSAVRSASEQLHCSLIYASVMLRSYRRKCARMVSASLAARTFSLNCPKRPLPPTPWMRQDL